MRKKVLVRGPALSLSGYGVHTRFALKSLREHEERFEIFIINTKWGQTGWIWENSEFRDWMDKKIIDTHHYINNKGQFDISVQVTIPQEWEKLAPVNIGVTAGTETTMISPLWVEKSNIMDHIITTSRHTNFAFEKSEYEARNEQTGETIKGIKCTTPLTAVSYPVREFEPKELSDFSFETDFNFLTVAQWSIRKNMEKTITWFVEEFIDQPVGLVVKTSIRNGSILDRHHTEIKLKNLLEPYKDRKCKIYLLHGDFTDEEMTYIYRHPQIKAIIGISHGEGFGLPLFEASYNDLPIVCSAWGGQNDFIFAPIVNKKGKTKMKPMIAKVDYDISPIQKEAVWENVLIEGSMWCYPKQGSYKMRLREVYKNYDRFKKQAQGLKKWVLEEFEAKKQYKKFADIVCEEDVIALDEWLKDLSEEVYD